MRRCELLARDLKSISNFFSGEFFGNQINLQGQFMRQFKNVEISTLFMSLPSYPRARITNTLGTATDTGEVCYQLLLARDLNYISNET
jgi:hypothetical protein